MNCPGPYSPYSFSCPQPHLPQAWNPEGPLPACSPLPFSRMPFLIQPCSAHQPPGGLSCSAPLPSTLPRGSCRGGLVTRFESDLLLTICVIQGKSLLCAFSLFSFIKCGVVGRPHGGPAVPRTLKYSRNNGC